MKNLFRLKLITFFFFFCQFIMFAQDNGIKIYESKLGNGTCAIVFPDDSGSLIVITGNGDCVVSKTMAMDDWQEMSQKTVVTVTIVETTENFQVLTKGENVKSPRDVATGQASGKRMHKPYLLSNLSLDALVSSSENKSIEIYSFSWGMSNMSSSGLSSTSGKSSVKPSYNVKSNIKARTTSGSTGCCLDGVCTVTVSVDRKHTKTGHVTLLK